MRTLLALVVAASPLAAQALPYGQDCSGESGVVPTFLPAGPPISGEELVLRVEGPPGLPGLIVVGTDDLQPGFPLDDDGFPGCFLHVASVLATVPFVLDGNGEASFEVVTWSAIGVELFAQVLIIDVGPETDGGLTRGLAIGSLDEPAEIVISEILFDPDATSDLSGEWIELYNPGDADVDIEGWTLSDDGFDSTVLDAGGAGILIPAGGYATLGNSGDPAMNGGIVHVATYSGFALANGADEVVLSDASSNEVDRVDYAALWPGGQGVAAALQPGALHDQANNASSSWSSATCPIGGTPYNTDLGTPGVANDLCLSGPPPTPSGALIFSEIMQNPAAVSDSVGEWFELHNPGGADYDMTGHVLSVGGFQELLSSTVIVPAGGYALFARNGDAGTNGGLPTPDYVFSSIGLGNGSTTCTVLDGSGGIVCTVSYDNGNQFPDPNGSSMTLDPDFLTAEDSQVGANWCEATTAYGSGDLGTPKTANNDCP